MAGNGSYHRATLECGLDGPRWRAGRPADSVTEAHGAIRGGKVFEVRHEEIRGSQRVFTSVHSVLTV